MRARTPLILALVVLAVAAGAVVLRSLGEADEAPLVPGGSAPAPAAPEAGETLAAPARDERNEERAASIGERRPASAAATEAPSPSPEAPEALGPEALGPGGLRVRTVDAAGAPVPGVPVALFMTLVGMGEDDRSRATTRAPDGLARLSLDDLGELRERLDAVGMSAGGLRFSVRARVASAAPVAVDLDGWPADGDEVTLQLPPTGSLLVRVVDEAGQPVPGEASVGWWWLPADVAADQPDAAYERVDSHFLTATDGVARISGIGLGLAFSVQASVPGRVHASEDGIVGPTEPGEEREVILALGAQYGGVTFRVLGPDGRPLAGEKLTARRFDDPERPRSPASGPYRGSWFSLATDADGRARIPLVPGLAEYDRRVDVERGNGGQSGQDDPDWALGSVWLPRRTESGVTVDLGDVALAPARTLLAGHVVDGAGAPVARAELRFEERSGPTPEHGWTNLPTGRLKTDAAGAFRLRGVRDPYGLRVTASAGGYGATTVEGLEPGDERVVITLGAPERRPAGEVALEVVLDEGVPFMRCLLRFERQEGGGRTPDWWAGVPITIGHLAPGTYDVWVETRDGDFELGRVEDVVVEDGGTTRDPRLLPLDLRGTARVVTLEAVRPDGTPWRRTWLALVAPGVGRSFRMETDDEGRTSFIVPLGVPSLRVARSGESAAQNVALTPGGGPTRVEFAP